MKTNCDKTPRGKKKQAKRSRLAKECAKLDPEFEKAMAEECMLKMGAVTIFQKINNT